jgi:ABC-type transporter Mla maintaining outer membrane lipid asymmetry permease subunit MlaE
MTHHPYTAIVFLTLLGVIAITGMIVGAVLAANDYSSAGAFSISAACVGVLGTLAAQRTGEPAPPDQPPSIGE